MAKPKKTDEERFKRWLVDKLKVTRWPYPAATSLAELSRKLGVRPEVLLQAQAELDSERRHQGLPLTRLGDPSRRSGRAQAQLTMQMPEEIHGRWAVESKRRGITAAVLFRSAVHRFLSFPDPPVHPTVSVWMVDGAACSLPWKPPARWPFWVNAYITRGAKEALTRRARAYGCPEFALLRAIMLDTLAGHLDKKLIYLTTVDGMWDDPQRYWTMEPREWKRPS